MSQTTTNYRKNGFQMQCEEFVGRKDETEIILYEYANVERGLSSIISVSGPAGIGKSYLIQHTVKNLPGKMYIYSKCTQGRSQETSALSDIINQITDQILTLPNDDYTSLCEKLNKNMGENIGILSSFSSYFAAAFNAAPTIDVTNFNSLKFKSKNAFIKLITIITEYFSPLILCVDDLQWANQLTLDVVQGIINKKNQLNIFLLLSLRDNEASAETNNLLNNLKSNSLNINLHPFENDDISNYMCGVLKEKIENKNQAINIVGSLSSGNPFFIRESIKMIIDEKILIFDKKKSIWKIDLKNINGMKVSNHIKKIWESKIIKGRAYNNNILNLLACFDGQLSKKKLLLISEMEPEHFNKEINLLLKDTIVFETQGSDGSDIIIFAHDIFLDTVIKKLDICEKELIHFQIAQKIYKPSNKNNISNNVLVASHLLRTDKSKLIDSAQKWIDILFSAGSYEMKMSIIEKSLAMFELCIYLLSHCEQVDDYLFVNLHLRYAESLCLSNRNNESTEIMQMLKSASYNTNLTTEIMRTQLYIYHYNREHENVLSQGIEIFHLLKLRFGKAWLVCDLLLCTLSYTKRKIKSIEDVHDASDPKTLLLFETLILMNSSATLIGNSLSSSIGLSAALLSANKGSCRGALVGYTSYAYVLFMIMHNLDKTVMMQDKILDLLKKTKYNENKSMVYFIIGAFLAHWSKSILKADEYLQRSIECAELTGEYIFIGYSITTSLDTKSFMSINLDELLKYIKSSQIKYSESEQYSTSYNYEAHTSHIMALKYGTDYFEYDKASKKYPKLSSFETLTEETLALERCCIMQDTKTGYMLAEAILPKLKLVKGFLCQLSIYLSCALIRILCHDSLKPSEQNRNLKIIKSHIKELKYWNDISIDNHQAQYLLAKVEYELCINHRTNAGELYNKVVTAAKKQDNNKIGAIAHLRASHYFSQNESLSHFYASHAAALFKKWGAHYICSEIESAYPKIHFDASYEFIDTKSVKLQNNSILNSFISAISKDYTDDPTKTIIDTILQNDFASYAAILCGSGDNLKIYYENIANDFIPPHINGMNIKYNSHISHSIIRYVDRSAKPVYSSPDERRSIFRHDMHLIANPELYIICIPINFNSVSTGMLYLESPKNIINDNMIEIVENLLSIFIIKVKNSDNSIAKSIMCEAPSLTKRELEILNLIAEGLSNSEICNIANISLNTTKKHINSIMSKLNVSNRIKAVITAKDLNIL